MSEAIPPTSNEKADIAAIRARCSQSITEIVDNPREYYRVQQILRDRTGLLAEVDRLLVALEQCADRKCNYGVRDLREFARAALSGEPNSAPSRSVQRRLEAQRASDETTASPQAPIVKVVIENGKAAYTTIYAPGLPDGTHDLYCEPEAVAPMMRSAEKASERPAAVAHGMRHCPTCGEELGEDGHHKPDPVPPLI